MNILCSGPGPHVPADGILGQSTVPVTGMRCSAAACNPALDPTNVAAATASTNQATLQQQAQAALAANRADQTQDGTIQTGAATINATAGPFTLAQCTTFIKQLATAVSTNAGNDINTKKELNALIRLALSQFDATN